MSERVDLDRIKRLRKMLATDMMDLEWHGELEAVRAALPALLDAAEEAAAARYDEEGAVVRSGLDRIERACERSEPLAYCEDVLPMIDELRAARRALEVVEQLAAEIEARQRHDEWRAAGSRGMSAPFHGELAGATPATMGVLSRWLRRLRRAQGGGE